jgi:hypothetical protein
VDNGGKTLRFVNVPLATRTVLRATIKETDRRRRGAGQSFAGLVEAAWVVFDGSRSDLHSAIEYKRLDAVFCQAQQRQPDDQGVGLIGGQGDAEIEQTGQERNSDVRGFFELGRPSGRGRT